MIIHADVLSVSAHRPWRLVEYVYELSRIQVWFGKLPPPARPLIFCFFSITFHIAVVIGSGRIAPLPSCYLKAVHVMQCIPCPLMIASLTLPLILYACCVGRIYNPKCRSDPSGATALKHTSL